MPERRHIVAVYPGSFDPVTHGHLDIIRRASGLFNEFIVGVGRNPDKDDLFSQRERVELIRPHVVDLPNVRVEAYDGLTTDFVQARHGRVVVRGIRDVTDLANEVRQANVNMAIGGLETIFLLANDQYVLTSSTFVKQIFELGGGDIERIKRLVPDNVAELLARKLGGALRNARRRAPAVRRTRSQNGRR